MLKLRVEEIAPSEADAASQAASLQMLVTARAQPLGGLAGTPANNGLKELLKTAEVSQTADRVVVTATFSPASLASLDSATKNSAHAQ